MKVYQAINAVQGELAKTGITKDRRNTQGSGYNFRGIDDVYNAIAPLLSQHGLCILPRVLSRQCEERLSKNGGALFYVTVEAEFDFVSAEDGSKHTVKTFGEAMDSGDKATNKAMSAAYKYAAFQAFSIPTEADNDADAHTHQVRSKVTPTAGAGESLTGEQRRSIEQFAEGIQVHFDAGMAIAQIVEAMEEQQYETEQKVYCWSLLDSKLRSAIMKHKNASKVQQLADSVAAQA